MHWERDDFQWRCFEGGYEWLPAEPISHGHLAQPPSTDTRFLVQRPVAADTRLYHPLATHPTLFKRFAALEPTETAFLKFAGQFGPLGVGLVRIEPRTPSGAYPAETTGEPLSRWMAAWHALRATVTVLDAIQSADADRLGQFITLEPDRATLRLELGEGQRHFDWLASPEHMRPWLWQHILSARCHTDQLARAARGWVQDQINQGLKCQLDGDGPAAVRVLFNPDRDAFGLHVAPTTLVAAMWFQCARVLTSNVSFNACEHCGKPFEISPDGRRRHTKYCDARCRVAAYRARRAKLDVCA